MPDRSPGATLASTTLVPVEGPPRHAVPSWCSVLVGFLAAVPVLVATVRAMFGGRVWVPVGDNALIATRAYDVLSRHHPLLGTWTSASLPSGTELHNPGPLQFDLMALPVELLGGRGVPLAVGAINVLAIVGVVWIAHRRGGPLLASAAALVAAALSWVMGSQLLVEPWQPHNTLLPFLCYLMLVWGVTCGDLRALPWAAGVGSFVLQTHLSYGLLVPLLGLWAVVGLALTLRAERLQSCGSARPAGQLKRSMALAALVLVLSWSQPLVEQVAGDGPGNLGELATSFGGSGSATGPALGMRVVSSVIATPPWWSRSSFHTAWLPPSRDPAPASAVLPSTGVAIASIALLLVILVGGGVLASRHGERDPSRAAAGGAVALIAALLTAASVPIGLFGLAPHQFRWLWPISAFASFAVLVLFGMLVRRRRGPAPVRALVVTCASATVVLAVFNLATGPASPSNSAERSMEVARGLNPQLGVLEGEGPVLVQLPPVFNDPYGGAVMAELARRDIPFLVVPEWTPQLGAGRRFTGDNARSVLMFRIGEATPPPGGRRIAQFEDVALYLSDADARD